MAVRQVSTKLSSLLQLNPNGVFNRIQYPSQVAVTVTQKISTTSCRHDLSCPSLLTCICNPVSTHSVMYQSAKVPNRLFSTTPSCFDETSEDKDAKNVKNIDKNMVQVFDSSGLFIGVMSFKKLQLKALKENQKVFKMGKSDNSKEDNDTMRSYKLMEASEIQREVLNRKEEKAEARRQEKSYMVTCSVQEHDLNVKIKAMRDQLMKGKSINFIVTSKKRGHMMKEFEVPLGKVVFKKTMDAMKDLTTVSKIVKSQRILSCVFTLKPSPASTTAKSLDD